jgi:holo-[acyl-carrier protein] synthase
VIGIGTDLVDLDRFRVVLARTPGLVDRLFTAAEQAYAQERTDPTERLGGRFAAKEAALKAMGVGLGAARFRDIEVVRAESGAPSLAVHGTAAARAAGLGVGGWLVTISHTDHVAQAVVVALAAAADTVDSTLDSTESA